MDERIKNLLPIGRGAVMRHGPHAAPLNQRLAELKAAVDEYARRDADVRASAHRLTDAEMEERRRGNAAVLATAVESLAQHVQQQRDAVQSRIRSASPVKPGEQASYHDVVVDSELRQHYRGMKPHDRARLNAQMMAEPWNHWRMVDALLRAPLEVSGLSHAEAQTIRVRLLAKVQPHAFREIDEQAAQVNSAVRAIGLAAQQLADAGVGWTRDAPTAAKFTHDPEQSAPLAWLPEGVESRYEPGDIE